MSDTPTPPVSSPGDDQSSVPGAVFDPSAVSAATDSASPGVAQSCDRTEIAEFIKEDFRTEYSTQRKPGPGLPEALGWAFGVLLLHVAASLLGGVVLVALVLLCGGSLNQLTEMGQLDGAYLALLIGGDQILALLVSLFAVSLRFSGRQARILNFSPVHPLHILAVIGLVLPLSSISGEVYRVMHIGWSRAVDAFPLLGVLDNLNAVEQIGEFAKTIPLPMLVIIIAVGPALAEELVFRGVIGRGLVARWGVVRGVLITSLLFAAVHMHPVHVVAVVPLGIAMHLIYLATRSFWAPVLLHFLNNAWASVASQMASTGNVDAAAMEAALSPTLLLASLTAIIVLGGLLYRTRTRYLQQDGSEWSPGYVTAEQPPAELLTTRDFGLCSRRTLVTAGSAWAAFAVAFVCELVAFAR